MFLATTLQLATPLILAALGCLLTVRAGVINIGVEGMMLISAFTAAIVSTSPLGPWGGLLAGTVAGVLLSAVLAWTHLHLGADIILAGIAINLIASGITATGLFAVLRSQETGGAFASTPLQPIDVPALEQIPVLDAVAHASPITWLMLLLVPIFIWLYFNSKQGIWTRAVGDNPSAVVEAGISPRAVQWRALLASGALAGLAGAQFSIFTTYTFVRDMTQGAGFIAVAAVYLGFRSPIGTVIAAFIFGAFQALSTVLQVRTDFPTDPILALPYVVTIIALAVGGVRYLRRRGGLRLV